MPVRIKRVYEGAAPEDGYRVLVDRIWPRGVSKEAAALDRWEKEVAPSSSLRKWFGHRPERFEEFRRQYLEELAGLDGASGPLRELSERAKHGTVTLVYGAKDRLHNQAAVLAELLDGAGLEQGHAGP